MDKTDQNWEDSQYRLVASEDETLTAPKWLRLVRDENITFIRLSMERIEGTVESECGLSDGENSESECELSDDENSESEEVSKQ